MITGIGIFVLLFATIYYTLEDAYYQFALDFDKQFGFYLDIMKFIISTSGGGIVLVVSATIFRSSDKGPTTSLKVCVTTVQTAAVDTRWSNFYGIPCTRR